MSEPPKAAVPARCGRVRLPAPGFGLDDIVFPALARRAAAASERIAGAGGEESVDRLR